MKQKLFALMLLMFVCSIQTSVFAQNDKKAKVEKRERPRISPEQMMQRQTRYVANQLALSDAAQAKFIEVYNKYQTELRSCHNQKREKLDKDRKAYKELTDAEITARIEARFAQSHKILDIREKYYNEFKKILTPRQIQKMYKAEKDIQKKVHKEMARRFNKAKKNKK